MYKRPSDKEIDFILRQTDIKDIELDYRMMKDLWRKGIEEIKKTNKLEKIHFYANIPFCISKCYNCPFYITSPKDNKVIESYLIYINKVIEYFRDTFKDVKLLNLYIGGGTPSILDEEQLEKLLNKIFSNFNFFDYGERTFECNPESMNEEKIKILKKYGINRITFGVQSLDPKILELHNRKHQEIDKVFKLIELLKGYDLDNNADLIFGLQKQTVKNVINTVEELMKRNVDQITLHQMMFQNIYEDNDMRNIKIQQFKKDLIPLLKELSDKYQYIFESAEFNFGSFIFKNKNKEIEKEKRLKNIPEEHRECVRYTDLDDYPNSCFGIGPNSINYLINKFLYRTIKPKNWYSDNPFQVFEENTVIAQGRILSKDYEVLNQLTKDIRNTPPELHIKDLNGKYNINFLDRYKDIINSFSSSNMIEVRQEKLIFNDNKKEYILMFLKTFAKRIRKNSQLEKYIFHKKLFNIKNSKFLDMYERLITNLDFDELECTCKIENNNMNPSRFNLWFKNDKILEEPSIGENRIKALKIKNNAVISRIFKFMEELNNEDYISINYDILKQIFNSNFKLENITTIIIGCDDRKNIKDSRFKLWFIIKNEDMIKQIINQDTSIKKLCKIKHNSSLLFGIDFKLDGKTSLKVYPRFHKENLIEAYKKNSLDLSESEKEWIERCNRITISNKTRGRIFHFHISDNNAKKRKEFIGKVNNDLFQEYVNKIDQAGYGVNVISIAKEEIDKKDIEKGKIENLNFYY